ncbi:MAG: hypothetical protein NTX71_05475 [Candidatus Aureabacteria bacterium]|nr:hypothetical protein [Candidatus Auribacterota bacterium]
MDIEVFALCDAATETGGKLNILGAFDCLYAQKFPVIHPQCSVALRIRFSQIEEGGHRIKINFVDEDGKPILPSLNANVEIKFKEEQHYVVSNLILNIHNFKIEKAGQYSIDLAIDGKSEKSLPLFVRIVRPRPDPVQHPT